MSRQPHRLIRDLPNPGAAELDVVWVCSRVGSGVQAQQVAALRGTFQGEGDEDGCGGWKVSVGL